MNNYEKPSKETLDAWSEDTKNWKLGLFYYNPQDKRIFPPKRFRYMGWTVNFANPYSYLTFAVILMLIIFISKYFPEYFH